MRRLIVQDEYGETANVLHFHGQNINQLTNTFNLIYNEHIVDSNYDRNKLAIVSTWTDEKLCCLLQQCKRFDIPLINCVQEKYDKTLPWYMPNKIKFFIETLESIDNELVMFLDGYDILLTHLDDIIYKFENQKYRILFGPSCNNYPNVQVDVIYGRTQLGVYRYFNAGCCIGYREDLLKFYKEALEYISIDNPWNSEQYVLRNAFAKYSNDTTQNFIGVDHKCSIFRSMGMTDSSYNPEEGVIYLKVNRYPKRHIIVTGSDGFIGKALVSRLRLDPDNVIYEIDRKRGLEAKNIDFLFNLKDIDAVFHLAAQTSVFNNDHEQIVDDNIATFVKIVNICNKYGTKLVYASSSTANNVTSTYGLSKSFDETFAQLYCPYATGVRLHNVYSEEPREGTLLWHIINDKDIVLYNNGKNKRHFTYLDNAVDGLMYAYSCDEKLINCYNPQEMSTEQFTSLWCKKLGKTYRLVDTIRERDREVQTIDTSLSNAPVEFMKVEDATNSY